jgi:hypothetical protein
VIWEGIEPLLRRLERWRPAGWIEHVGGGLQVCHVPDEGDLAYLHTLYPGLSEDRLAQTEAACDRQMPAEYRRFLGWANGADFFRQLGLNGSHIRGPDREPIDRSGAGVGQTISLDYGNQFERPAGAPHSAWVVGTVSGWSGQGYLLLRQDGGVALCSATDATDVAASWESFSHMLFSEFDRMAGLVDDRGERLAPHEYFLPESARRWEKPKGGRRGLLDLLRAPK